VIPFADVNAESRNRPARASGVEMTEIVLPVDTNQYGNVWGGRVMALIDKAAAVAATRHCRTNVVTASVDSLTFRAPVRLGHILRLYASVNASFRTSMEVGVKVLSEDPLTGKEAHCCSAYVTMVSLDATGRPTEVPGLAPSGAAGRRRRREAELRRKARLALRHRKEVRQEARVKS
jgi:acyl-CoA hydrolase